MKTHPISVLLVDDNPHDALLTRETLNRCPTTIKLRHAKRLSDAIEQLQNDEVDVVLLDLCLPDGGGFEGLNRLGQQFPNLPVLLIAGLDDADTALRAVNLGAQDFIVKYELRPEQLERRIRLAVERHQKQRQNAERLGELEESTRRDPLTGMLNRRGLDELAEKHWEIAFTRGELLSCIILDLDYFKRINDVHGHHVGDAALVQVAQLLMANSRRADVVARYGGEEFCLLLPDTSELAATNYAEGLRRRILSYDFVSGATKFRLSGSFGVAGRSSQMKSQQQLLQRADEALLSAKQAGRNRVVDASGFVPENAGRNVKPATQHALDRCVAQDVMTSVITFPQQHQQIAEAAGMLLQLRIDSLPVVDEKNQLVGTIDEDAIIAEIATHDSWHRPIEKIINTSVVTYASDTPARLILEFLCRVSLPRVIVVDEGSPVGVISRAGLIRWYKNRLGTALPPAGASASDESDRVSADTAHLVTDMQDELATLMRAIGDDSEQSSTATICSATRLQQLLEDLLRHASEARTALAGADETVGLTVY